ncbi:nuclear pore complex protein Nup98-Nup96 [Neocloeon triangulifer]|uniref:nuclear pore complex protein Nup98-Nup96 n=1 Tax=Neocloeon triangulifer TaxID=2078957 RepID=UPI00286F98B1|nr:nuclear pore complex protein Nup98-Nup96 [Neocloeon triangulifer]
MFNKQAFGSTPSTSTFGGFGTATTATTPFGQSFNKPATGAPGFQSTGFAPGGGSLFGTTPAATSTGLFGASQPQQPAFGQQQSQQQSAFSGFNSGGGSSLFGSTASTSFAQPKPTFGGFGAPTQSSGLFGSQPAVSTATSGSAMFSGQTSAGLFGSSGFGTTNSNVVGTPIKFNPLAGTDTMVKNNQTTTISTRHQCITCMKEYENKSLEELRIEDLQAGRKGPQQGAVMFGGTAQPQQSSLFGASPLGQPSTSFGENKSLFGATSTANTGLSNFGNAAPAFGATGQTGSGLFGKPSAFGAPASSAATGFSFSGSNNNAAANNPFGGAAAQKPFGAPATNTMFGAQPTSLFGATPTTNTGFSSFGVQPQQQPQQQIGLFGQAKPAATPFGMAAPQPTSQTSFGFGQNTATNTTTGLFGNKPALGTGLTTGFGGATSSPFGAKPLGTSTAPAFGTSFQQQPATSLGGGSTLFGQTKQAAPTFGFGGQQQQGAFGLNANPFGAKPAAPTNLFGNTASGGGLFGNTTTTSSNLFGNTGAFGGGSGLTLGQTPSFTANKPFGGFGGATLGGQQAQAAPQSQAAHQNIMNLTSYPYGDQPLFRNLGPDKVEELRLKATNPAAQKAAIAQSPSFSVSSKSSPRLAVKPPSATPAKSSLFEGLEGSSPFSPYKSLAAAITPKSSIKLLKLRPDPSNLTPGNQPSQSTPLRAASSKFRDILPAATPPSSTPRGSAGKSDNGNKENELSDELSETLADVRPARKLALEESQGPLNATDASICLSDISEVGEEEAPSEEPHPAGIVLRRAGYYTIPSLHELAKLFEETGECKVPSFLVGRSNYGNIFFDEPMDVAGLNLDDIVHIRHREVVVYPNDEEKPALGQGLNRRAQVTLDRIYPVNKQTRAPIRDPETILNMDYDSTLRRACVRMKARFVDYRPDNGSWVFKVDHFSKYGLPDESDDDDEMLEPGKPVAQAPPKPPAVQPAQQPPAAPPKQHTLSDSHVLFNTSVNMTNLETMDEDYLEILSPNEQMPRLTGMDTSKIRLMKASLFENEDSVYGDEKMVEDEFHFEKPASPSFAAEELEVALPEREARPSRPHQRPTIVTPRAMPFPPKLPTNMEGCAADSALFHGRCAQTSWTSGGALVATHDQLVSLTCPYLASNTNKALVEEQLLVQLQLSRCEAAEGEEKGWEVPRWSPREGGDLLVAHSTWARGRRGAGGRKERMVRQVLLLCHTLWGDSAPQGTSEGAPTRALEAHARRKGVCEWLEGVVREEEAAEPSLPTHTPEHALLATLAQGRLLEAVQACQRVGDHYLALTVASSGASPYPRHMVLTQLEEWVSVGASHLVNGERLRAWLLCGAGAASLVREEGEGALNALEGLPWWACLAAHAWFLGSPAASVPDVLAKYEAAVDARLAAAPLPPDGAHPHRDLRFHLLKLFAQRTYPLEPLLAVETHFPDAPLDFSLSWLLMGLLESLHYTHVSSHCSQNLHLLFAEQLEAVGLWHWAVFVLQHLASPAARSSAVEKVIVRHVVPDPTCPPKTLTQRELFLVDKLGIPAKIIYSAKATHCKGSNRHVDLAFYHLYAEEWNECYQTVISHLAADAVINDEWREVRELLRELQAHSHEIDEWHDQGQVVLTFLTLSDELASLRFSSEGRVGGVAPRVAALHNHLRLMPCASPKHRLCRSEMALKLQELLRALVPPSDQPRLNDLDQAMKQFVLRNDDPPSAAAN